jgi:hypothetical protein
MLSPVDAETGRKLINIFIKVSWLWLELSRIFVIDTATGIFRLKFPN